MDNSVDAWVVLGTKLNSKQFEKDLRKELRQMEKLTEEKQELIERKLKIRAEVKLHNEEVNAQTRKIKEEMQQALATNGLGAIGAQNIKEEASRKILALNQENTRYLQQADDKEAEIIKKLRENAQARELINQEIGKTTQQLEHQRGLEETAKHTDQMSKNADKFFKKITRAGLAIFGIRSLYLGIRRIMSSVLGQNEKLKNQYDGMMSSLASAFTPIVKKIINLMLTLMGYANAIWQKLFKKDLFKSTAKSAEKTAGAAKEINKQLAGFDEANVLTAGTSGGGSSSSSGGIDIPVIKLPDWLDNLLDFIKKHPKLAGIIFGTTAFTLFGLVQLGKALTAKAIAKLIGTAGAGETAAGATGLLGLLGILTLLATTAYVIYLDYTYLKEAVELGRELEEQHKRRDELNKENIKNNNTTVQSNFDVLKSEESTNEEREKAIKNVDIMTTSTRNMVGATGAGIKNNIDWGKTLLDNAGGMDKLYRAGKLNDDEQYEYYKMLMEQLNPTMEKTYGWMYGQTEVSEQLKEDFEGLNKKFSTKYTIEMSETGSNKILTAAQKVADKFGLLGEKISSAFKTGQSLGVNVTNLAKSIFHAEGGIVNLPGRGVPVNHIAGEAGREGIVPMDNQQQMEILGQAIAKYVNINNYVTTNVDSRKLNQILKQSENKERLANNW